MKKHAGISLSEVLLSLFLASLVATMLMQFYSSTKHQYIEAKKILSEHFDVRWVSDLMSDSIRRAGFTPCLGLDHLSVSDSRSPGVKIQAVKFETEPQRSLQINRMSEHFAQVQRFESTTQIVLDSPIVLNKKRPLLIADCEHAEVVRILNEETEQGGTRIILTKPMHSEFLGETYVGEFLEERWFIKKNRQKKNTLYYQLKQTDEITSLIHSLTVKIQNVAGRQFIEVIIGLSEDKFHKLMVAVRGS